MNLVAPHRLRTPAEPIPSLSPDAGFVVVISSGVTSTGLTQDGTVGEDVLSGGVAVSNTVNASGLVTVESGGVTRSDTVMSGGIEHLSSGAVASVLTVSSGGLVSGPGVVASGGSIAGYGVGFKVGGAGGFLGNVGIQSGGLVSAIEVDDFGVINVSSGGEAEAVVLSGGAVTVDDGALLSGVIVSRGGLVDAGGGQTSGVQVFAGGELDVGYPFSSGVTASAASVQIANKGVANVGSNGLISGVTIHAGGEVEVTSGGGVARASVAGGTLDLELGAQASGATVASGGVVEVGHAAGLYALTLNSGSAAVATFGEVLGITAARGTTISVDGAVADGAIFGAGGVRDVAATITGEGLLVEEGGGTMLLDGDLSGFAGGLVLDDGAIELKAASGVGANHVEFFNLESGLSTLQIDAVDQPASGSTFAPLIRGWTSATDRVDLAGRAFVSGATAKVSGDVLTLKDGAYTASFDLEGQRATRYVVVDDGHAGTLIRPVLNAPVVDVEPALAFTVVVSSGVVSSGLSLDSTKHEEVLSGGVALSNTVNSGGLVTVDAGGLTSGDVISSGGEETLLSGATTSNVLVQSGGLLDGSGFLAGAGEVNGYLVGVKVTGPRGVIAQLNLNSGAIGSSIEFDRFGYGYVNSGALLQNAVVDGGLLSIASGGVGSGTVLRAGALQVFGSAQDTKINGGVAVVEGDTVSGSSVSGLISNTQVFSGGTLQVLSGGVATSATVASGGFMEVVSSGAASVVALVGGGLAVDLGGVVEGLTVGGGSTAQMAAFSEVVNGFVNSGRLVVGQGAIAALVGAAVHGAIDVEGTLAEGGYFSSELGAGTPGQTISGQITGSGLIVEAGPGALKIAGDTTGFTGEIQLDGGKVELASVTAASEMIFDKSISTSSPTAVLQLDAGVQPAKGATFGATLTDFFATTDRLDLAGVAFTSGARARLANGVLTLVDGAYTAKFKLDGETTSRYVVADDGHGGTLIRGSVNLVSTLRQATAGFGAPAPGSVGAVQESSVASALLAAAHPHGAGG